MVRLEVRNMIFIFVFQNKYYTNVNYCFFTGSGMIEQDISKSSSYYVSVGNLNTEDVEVIVEL